MLSRRAFVGASTATVLGAAYRAALPDPLGALTVPEVSSESPQELPPSIAALHSMRDRARPITVEERRGRLEKARRLMREHSMQALVLTGGTSLEYYSNISWGLSERLLALVVPASGKPFIVSPAFEEARAREQLEAGPFEAGSPVYTWQEDENPYRLVSSGLRQLGIATGRLGIEETVRFVFSNGIAREAPALDLVSATPVTAGCRGVKDEHELELMQLANRVTLKAYEAAYRALEEGMTQDGFARLVRLAHQRLGFAGGAGVQVGEFSALPHGSITPQVVREGTILLIDGGCSVEGYRSDISRTFVLGRATDKMKRVFEIEHRAQSAALAAAGPGVECQAVDAAARQVIAEAGYGPDYRYFSHRVGHGIGMDGHEWPYLVRGNTLAMRPGMTFSDEPGIYIRGEFGVRLEDDMVITEEGARLFTPQSPSLEEPFATV
ncbi:MAG: M24 family metallopeptidase [Gemmatimonadota bacterium]